jgi:hypothetical protein
VLRSIYSLVLPNLHILILSSAAWLFCCLLLLLRILFRIFLSPAMGLFNDAKNCAVDSIYARRQSTADTLSTCIMHCLSFITMSREVLGFMYLRFLLLTFTLCSKSLAGENERLKKLKTGMESKTFVLLTVLKMGRYVSVYHAGN